MSADGQDVQTDDLFTEPLAPVVSAELITNRFRPGQSGNPGGRSSQSKLSAPIRKRFRRLFKEDPGDSGRSLAAVVVRMARGEDLVDALTQAIGRANWGEGSAAKTKLLFDLIGHAVTKGRATQLKAIEFIFREGFGRTPISDEQIKKQAEKLLEAMVEHAQQEREGGA